MKKECTKYKKIVSLLLVFLLFCILFYCFPLTGDDWGKDTGSLLFILKNGIKSWSSLNGRFFGNILVMLLKSSIIFKVIFSSTITTSTLFVCSRYEKNESINTIFLSLLLFLSMPLYMFRESISWMSGFANFAVPPLAISAVFFISKDCFYRKNVKITRKYYVLAIISSIFMNLFAEHTSIFSVILGVLLILTTYLSQKKVYKYHIVFLITSFISCTLMFLSPTYSNGMIRLGGKSLLEDLSLMESIINSLKNTSWVMNSFFDNFAVNFVIGIAVISNFKKYKKMYLKIISLILSFILSVISPVVAALSYIDKTVPLKLLLGILVIYVILMLVLIFENYYKSNKGLFYELLLLFISKFVLIIPLLVASGIGPRCFYALYIIDILFMFALLKNLMSNPPKIINILIYIGCVGASILIVFVSINNKHITDIREKIIKDAIKNNEVFIYLPKYKYRYWIHQSGEPQGRKYHIETFKTYYGMKEQVILSFVPLESFSESIKKDYIDIFQEIQIPTYDGSGEPTHPCIVTLNTPISGYKYWMVYTPWPNNQNKYENPSIVASNDKIMWEVPTGVVNPISGEPKYKYDYYSDPYMFYNNDNKEFEMWYRFNPYNYNGEKSTTTNNILLRKKSKDGINWQREEIIFDDETNQTYMSTSVVYFDKKYSIWYSALDHSAVHRHQNNDGTWSTPQKIDFYDYNGTIWHEEVRKTEYGYEIFFNNYLDDKLYFSISNNMVNFGKPLEIDTSYLERNYFGKKRDRVYKFAFIDEENTFYFYIPLHKYRNNRSHWSMYLKTFNKKELYKNYFNLQSN